MGTKNILAISTLIAVTVAVSILVAFSATASAAPIQDAIDGEPDEIEAMPYGDNDFVVDDRDDLKIGVERSVAAEKNEVTVDDDGSADYSDIQTAIDDVSDGTKIKVMPGTYSGFVVDSRNDLKIKSTEKGNAIVTGTVTVPSYRGPYDTTIGVTGSRNIEISHFTVIAGNTDPHTIVYFDSTGKVKHNDVGGNTGNTNPGNAIGAASISSPGTVEISKNYIHDYGKIGIWVNSWGGSASIPGGIYAEITDNTIVGTDFADYYRVQDGIQVTYGGSAKIEKNDISKNFQTGGSYWTCDGILIYDAHEVTTNGNKIHDNNFGISIEDVTNAKLDHDKLDDNTRGLDTRASIPCTMLVKHIEIEGSDYGWVNWGTDGIVLEECKMEENYYGIYSLASYGGSNPTATLNHCEIRNNYLYDIVLLGGTMVLHKTTYDVSYVHPSGTLIET